jgi:hypothetical protein
MSFSGRAPGRALLPDEGIGVSQGRCHVVVGLTVGR